MWWPKCREGESIPLVIKKEQKMPELLRLWPLPLLTPNNTKNTITLPIINTELTKKQ